jgi:hypothetical protein
MTSAKVRLHIGIISHKLPKNDRYMPPYRMAKRAPAEVPIRSDREIEPAADISDLN